MIYSKIIVCGFAIFYVNGNDAKCLMLRRSDWVSSPNTWSIPIGHAEEDELSDYYLSGNKPSVLLKVALRELREETGLTILDLGDIYDGYIKVETGIRDAYIFSSIVNDELYNNINNRIILDQENDDFMWVDLGDLHCSDSMIDIFFYKFDLFLKLFNSHIESLTREI